MYEILAAISNTEVPIIFKGALITKLVLKEQGFDQIERMTRDIDAKVGMKCRSELFTFGLFFKFPSNLVSKLTGFYVGQSEVVDTPEHTHQIWDGILTCKVMKILL